MARRRWRVRLSAAAERDFVGIVQWTSEMFGRRHGRIYRRTLIDALTALHQGPNLPGGVARDDIQPGLRSLHVARTGRRGRHFILYRSAEPDSIEIVRILHDSMDIGRHIPAEEPPHGA